MQLKPEYKKKPIRSYVLRTGRMTDSQKRAFEKYWPRYGLSLQQGIVDPVRIFGRAAPLVLEIGFGMGDSLLQMAMDEQDKDFIGIEVHPPGVGRLINRAGELGLSNVRVFLADALDVLEDCIADKSLARLQLYFPDPWHKKKHNKRRIVTPEFVRQAWCKLAVGGILHMATDWYPYAEQMLEIMTASEGYRNLAGNGFAERPSYRPVTKFENRGERLGHGVWDLMFVKKRYGDDQ